MSSFAWNFWNISLWSKWSDMVFRSHFGVACFVLNLEILRFILRNLFLYYSFSILVWYMVAHTEHAYDIRGLTIEEYIRSEHLFCGVEL